MIDTSNTDDLLRKVNPFKYQVDECFDENMICIESIHGILFVNQTEKLLSKNSATNTSILGCKADLFVDKYAELALLAVTGVIARSNPKFWSEIVTS